MDVIKRDGAKVAFDREKIRVAIHKSGVPLEDSEGLAKKVLFLAELHHGRWGDITVEYIQDKVEETLMLNRFTDQAKAYILYRAERAKLRVPKIQHFTEDFAPEYPEAETAADYQDIKLRWNHKEFGLEKDIQSMVTELTATELKAVTYLQKLFTLYEADVGEKWWAGRFCKIFPRHEFQRLGITFAQVELQVHAPFYRKLNKLMRLEHPQFYTEYKEEAVLKERMAYLDKYINHENDLIALAVFALMEGVVLFSSFAYFRHFQANGKNKLTNFVTGVSRSAEEEEHHSNTGIWAFNLLKKEACLNPIEEKQLINDIRDAAEVLCDHELQIVRKLFSFGDIDGVCESDFTDFITDRLGDRLGLMGVDNGYHRTPNNPIKKWFSATRGYVYNDFFNRGSGEYSRDWDMSAFTF